MIPGEVPGGARRSGQASQGRLEQKFRGRPWEALAQSPRMPERDSRSPLRLPTRAEQKNPLPTP